MTADRAWQLADEAIVLHDRLTALAGLAVRYPLRYPRERRQLRQIMRARRRVEARIERRWRIYHRLRDREMPRGGSRPLEASL